MLTKIKLEGIKSMAKYLCIHDKYDRYGGGGTISSRFDADSDAEALVKIMDNCMYSYSDSNDAELGDEDFIMPSTETCINRIESMNGDGCDYILRIENLDSKEVLFESEDFTIQDEVW